MDNREEKCYVMNNIRLYLMLYLFSNLIAGYQKRGDRYRKDISKTHEHNKSI